MNKHFIIYKTTNLLNGRFYIGMHVTTNIDDGYLGSGRRIKAEIKKYGRENFARVILEELPSKEELVKREAELVTEDLRADALCLNLKNGGEGGFTAIASIAGNKSKKRTQQQHFKAAVTRRENGFVTCFAKPRWFETPGFSGRKHTEETRRKMSLADRSGEKNSQFGTCWVTNGTSSKKIKVAELDKFVKLGYRRGR